MRAKVRIPVLKMKHRAVGPKKGTGFVSIERTTPKTSKHRHVGPPVEDAPYVSPFTLGDAFKGLDKLS